MTPGNKTMVTKKTKSIKIGGKEVMVEKLNLRRMAKLLSAVDALPDQMIVDAKNGSEADTARSFIGGVIEALPDIAGVICEVLKNQIKPEELLEAELEEVIDLIEAFLEINNVPKIMKRLGNVRTLATGQKPKKAA